MPSLEEQIRQFVGKAKVKMETATRMFVIQIASSMIDRSPVDTGRFRGAWVYGSGSVPDTPDQSGDASKARIYEGLQGWKPGETILITNNLPYAYRLEHGWSKQAPSGMVSVTVTEFQSYLDRALGGMKQ